MIIEVRTYTLQPGTLAEVEKRFGEALPHREKHGEHVASPSVDPERWISQRPLWRSACTPAVNRLPPLRRRLASAAPRSIACSAVATTEHFVMVQWRC